ncbi:hypothetical protein N9K31_02230, partial [bacterium]|nr:hypothetical protein [bacterium]
LHLLWLKCLRVVFAVWLPFYLPVFVILFFTEKYAQFVPVEEKTSEDGEILERKPNLRHPKGVPVM